MGGQKFSEWRLVWFCTSGYQNQLTTEPARCYPGRSKGDQTVTRLLAMATTTSCLLTDVTLLLIL